MTKKSSKKDMRRHLLSEQQHARQCSDMNESGEESSDRRRTHSLQLDNWNCHFRCSVVDDQRLHRHQPCLGKGVNKNSCGKQCMSYTKQASCHVELRTRSRAAPAAAVPPPISATWAPEGEKRRTTQGHIWKINKKARRDTRLDDASPFSSWCRECCIKQLRGHLAVGMCAESLLSDVLCRTL